MPTSARRRAQYDDVSFSPPRERPREWQGDTKHVRCRNGHALNYVVVLKDYQRHYDKVQYTGECRLFARCKLCDPWGYQLGVWDVGNGRIEWYAIPSEDVYDELCALPGKTPTAAVLEILRQRWGQ